MMSRFWILAPLALLVSSQGGHHTLPLHLGGRAVDAGDGSLRFGWPGVYFEGRFHGTWVKAEADPRGDYLRLLIDGEEKAVLTRPGRAVLNFDGLRDGDHVIRIEKMTESQSGSARFFGFSGDRPLPARVRPRAIEFIGDSYTVGYGNTSPTRDCDRQRVHDTTDTTRAFGPLVAKRLGAEYRVHAYSGYGIVRNYNGNAPGENLPFLYARAIPGEPAPAAADGWRPQQIVINLGTNDFSTPLHAGETWQDAAALHAAYRAGYVAFVRRLMAAQPQAQLILMGSDPFYGDVEQVAATVNANAGKPVVPLQFETLELTGCNWHPSLKDHRDLAELVMHAIAKTS